ncbi:MAG: efflux RND transporter periplasmic adaptor subunit [Anditalea sp.]
MKKFIHHLSKAFLQGLFLTLVLTSCKTESKPQIGATVPKEVPVYEVTAIDTTLLREYVADIEAVQNVELRARVQGFLEEILVDEGHYVRKGQVLFKTNDEEYKAELAKASANLESAIAEAKAVEYEVDRLRIMVDNNVISASELHVTLARHNAVLAKIEEAKSAERNASVQLSYTEIKAPFNGLIDRIPFKIGSLIGHGNLLTTVSDISAIHVYFNVSEREYLEYIKAENDRESNTVKLILADGSTYPYDGQIETMQGEFNANTGTIAFRARFPNPKQVLKHGATGKVVLTKKINGAIIVPQKAVFEIQDRNYVFVVDVDNTVKMKSFVPKARFSHYYVVDMGIEVGEKLVYEGIQNLKEGMPITPNFIALDLVEGEQENDPNSQFQ